MKTVKWQGHYWCLIREEGNKLIVFPVGGGFESSIPKAEATMVKGVPQVMVECYVRIEDGEPYKCMANPFERWNGWAQPYFTKETLMKVLEDSGVQIKYVTENSILFKFPEQNDNELEHADKTDQGWSVSGWCWNIATKDGKAIYSDGSVEDDKE